MRAWVRPVLILSGAGNLSMSQVSGRDSIKLCMYMCVCLHVPLTSTLPSFYPVVIDRGLLRILCSVRRLQAHSLTSVFFFSHLTILCACTCKGQKTISGYQFFLSTMWFPGIKLRLSSLSVNILISWAILPDQTSNLPFLIIVVVCFVTGS